MLSKKYKSELINIKKHFNEVYTLEFRSLNGKYKYQPGQFLHLAIDYDYDGSGQWPDSRCFSMQSNPHDETIKITYSIKGKFTQQMEQILKVGSMVWLKLPFGDLFAQPHNKTNTVFISGGTGITPYLSLFTHESFNDYSEPRVYMGFRSALFNIYEDELKNLKSNTVKFYYEDLEGVIDINQIFDENSPKCFYFISGPPIMIKSFKDTLIARGLSSTQILTDDWG